jgi:hypothetical protein
MNEKMIFTLLKDALRSYREKKSEILNLLSTKHDDELLIQLFLKYIKSKYGPKIMKLVEM